MRDQEPDRTVQLAVEEDEIALERSISYLNSLDSPHGARNAGHGTEADRETEGGAEEVRH